MDGDSVILKHTLCTKGSSDTQVVPPPFVT